MSEINELQASAADGKLMIVTGAGVSIALANADAPSLNWAQLVADAVRYAEKKGTIDDSQRDRWLATIDNGDIDELLSSAGMITKKMGGRSGLLYSRWLQERFAKQTLAAKSPMRNALNAVRKNGILLATLNYDNLIEKATRLSSIHMGEPNRVLEWARRETSGVLHLHGIYTHPDTIVLDSADYLAATSEPFRTNIQRGLATFNRILFIGCGDTLEDPNFASLLSWSRDTLGSAGLMHYALVADRDVESRHKDPNWAGLVTPISYGNNYGDLPKFILENIAKNGNSQRSKIRRSKPADSSSIDTYRQHLLSESGKMTIEGVRADAETAKEKFEIERLFVPLEVSPFPPELPASTPEREKRLKEWEEKHGQAITFGASLENNPRIALLALPGAGKTILLKRLAVAYADASRRAATQDNLPEMDVVPVLIKCREWRAHINLPIASIIGKIWEITGNRSLKGLYNVLLPRFKTGNVLLLIDGLDEIHEDADRATFVDNLETFLERFPNTKLVVTSREAGFALVAPSLMRFCSRWRIAPLNDTAIAMLCQHWHTLMASNAVEGEEDSNTVVKTIFSSVSLRRLAENPLLLTMLLVVKHGNGRLPPDRVSLYKLAVEVLIDAWNIKGHAPLGVREAVPQLAYIAFRMSRLGQSVVTETELLRLIEDCRRDIPLVQLYAKDSPSEFLRRVELRSSLLLEAGRQKDGALTVPIYQFRHLTFQEYLSAVAIVDGHYKEYKEGGSPLEPILSDVLDDRWKEVIPMAAVLAKKQAAPLLGELIRLASSEEDEFLSGGHKLPRYSWTSSGKLSGSLSGIFQCLVEEAEFTVGQQESSLRLMSTFAQGCRGSENWPALMRGPFGEKLLSVAWQQFVESSLPEEAFLRNTVAQMAFHRNSIADWLSEAGLKGLIADLSSPELEVKSKAAASICGILWSRPKDVTEKIETLLLPLIETLVPINDYLWEHSLWAIALMKNRYPESTFISAKLPDHILDLVVSRWLEQLVGGDNSIVGYGLTASLTFRRGSWKPSLSESSKRAIRNIVETNYPSFREGQDVSKPQAAALLAYHGSLNIPNKHLITVLDRHAQQIESRINFVGIYRDLGAEDRLAGRGRGQIASRRNRR